MAGCGLGHSPLLSIPPASFDDLMMCFLCADFQNMPNAIRPAAPRPQTFSTIRPTTNQVPRMMASQRMGESSTSTHTAVLICAVFLTQCVFVCVCSISAVGATPNQCRSSYGCSTSASGAAVQVHAWSAQHTATPGHTSTPATGTHTSLQHTSCVVTV